MITPCQEETIEVVILVRACLVRRSKTTDERLREALDELRKQRFEVDVYIRGCWRPRKYGKIRVLPETLIPRWQPAQGEIRCEVEALLMEWRPCRPLGGFEWHPATRHWLRPEIVLRGTRRVQS